MLTVLDEFTRQALAVEAGTRITSDDVLEVRYRLFLRHGKPEFVRSDNGPEFAAEAMQIWLERVGVKPIRIYPGSPWENGYKERFNGTLRREVLNVGHDLEAVDRFERLATARSLQRALEAAGATFIEKNCGGPGVRLSHRQRCYLERYLSRKRKRPPRRRAFLYY